MKKVYDKNGDYTLPARKMFQDINHKIKDIYKALEKDWTYEDIQVAIMDSAHAEFCHKRILRTIDIHKKRKQ